ncbi:MAG: hypothetical protein CL608_17015 [Anaerolineaceae bacterium]|nr:hypothetical protein [Anaerolineaceae bacterium]
MRIIDILIGLLTLTGCTAIAAVPVSMPVWIIIGILFVFRIGFRKVWLAMSIICLLQFSVISLWGISVWIVDGYPSSVDSLIFGSITAAIITAFTLLLSHRYFRSQSARAWIIMLQSGIAVMMTALVITVIFIQ